MSILNGEGKSVSKKIVPVTLSAYDRSSFTIDLSMPKQTGGYLLLAEFKPDNNGRPVISRRFIKVGVAPGYKYFDMKPVDLK